MSKINHEFEHSTLVHYIVYNVLCMTSMFIGIIKNMEPGVKKLKMEYKAQLWAFKDNYVGKSVSQAAQPYKLQFHSNLSTKSVLKGY